MDFRCLRPCLILACSVFLVACPTGLYAVEIGDMNGDGRVSFGDAALLELWEGTGLDLYEPVPGADDFGDLFECSSTTRAGDDATVELFHEAIRRMSPDPLPHFKTLWPIAVEPIQDPPPPDPRVRLELLDVIHSSGESLLGLKVRLSSSERLWFMAFGVQGDGLDLRAPERRLESLAPRNLRLFFRPEYYLLSRGMAFFHTAMLSIGPNLKYLIDPVEDLVLDMTVVLPRGTAPGTYRLELLEGAEVVTELGEVITPEIEGAFLEITEEILDGPTQPFPPLDFVDLENRRIGGSSEIRITNAAGFPGDEVTVKVQIRTSRPTNIVGYLFQAHPKFGSQTRRVFRAMR